jgi:hypothetical protein
VSHTSAHGRDGGASNMSIVVSAIRRRVNHHCVCVCVCVREREREREGEGEMKFSFYVSSFSNWKAYHP